MFSNCFYLMVTKFVLALLSKNILKIRYSKSCILYQIAYTTIKALLYQPQRFILTFKSNRTMVSFGGKHCKYDMHIHFNHPFLALHLSRLLMTKTILHKVFVRTIYYSYVCINHYPQHCFVFLHNFLLMCNAFVFYLKKQDIFKKKTMFILILYHLFILMFIYIQRFIIQDSCNDLAMPHSV